VLNRYLRTFLAIGVLAGIGGVTASPAWGQQAQQPAKNWKDRAEYDLYASILNEKDPAKKLALLNSWTEKYPQTEYGDERAQLYLTTYQQAGQLQKMVDTAKEMLAKDPKNVQALVAVVYFTPGLNNTSPDMLDLADKASQGLLGTEKPAQTAEGDWNNLKAFAHRTRGWAAMQRKNNDAAELAFKESLKINPNSGEVSYWLGTVMLAQKKPEKQSEVLFHFARAASFDGPGALNPQGRQQIDAYFVKAFNSYHGPDPGELEKLRAMAKANAFPPPDFKIKTATEIAIEKEEEFKKTNPQLALWMSLKKELTGDNGEAFFASNMKDANVPGGAGDPPVRKFKATLIEARPAVKSKELVVGLADSKVPEVTLKLETPLAGKPEVGGPIEFEGVPVAFTKDPFMVTFDVENDKITGLNVEAAAPTRKGAGGKKGGGKKKK
jgi:tetratricopeptide (TPR) repeat protein